MASNKDNPRKILKFRGPKNRGPIIDSEYSELLGAAICSNEWGDPRDKRDPDQLLEHIVLAQTLHMPPPEIARDTRLTTITCGKRRELPKSSGNMAPSQCTNLLHNCTSSFCCIKILQTFVI